MITVIAALFYFRSQNKQVFISVIPRQWSLIFNMNSFSLLGSLLDSNYKEFFGFLTLGTVVYFGYGIRHSALNSPTNTNKKKHNRPEQKTSPSGVCLSPSNTNVKKKIASFLTKKTNKFCYDVRTVSVSQRARVPRYLQYEAFFYILFNLIVPELFKNLLRPRRFARLGRNGSICVRWAFIKWFVS